MKSLLLFALFTLSISAQTTPLNIGTINIPDEIVVSMEAWRIRQHKTVSTPSTLSGGINASATSITVTTPANIIVGDQIVIDDEAMNVTAKAGGVLTVVRARANTTGAAHATAAVVNVTKFSTGIIMARQFIKDKVIEILDRNPPASIVTQQTNIAAAQAAIQATKDGSVQ